LPISAIALPAPWGSSYNQVIVRKEIDKMIARVGSLIGIGVGFGFALGLGMGPLLKNLPISAGIGVAIAYAIGVAVDASVAKRRRATN
jgi:hypothetical protein